MADPIFAHPRLAQIYDAFEGRRDDSDAYLAVADELGARSVLDLGYGTGSLALRLAATGPRTLDVPGVGAVEQRREVLEVRLPLVRFRLTSRFLADDEILTSDSVLRFRTRDGVTASLTCAGCTVDDVREAPDRPGHELVFLAHRA